MPRQFNRRYTIPEAARLAKVPKRRLIADIAAGRAATVAIQDSRGRSRELHDTQADRGHTPVGVCPWCGNPCPVRPSGGSERKFCSKVCRTEFHTACRKWAQCQFEAGHVSIAELKIALQERTRFVDRDFTS